jgi:hypothetical protein
VRQQTSLPGHPYVTYFSGPDALGDWWILCNCSACGADWQWKCSDPQNRANGHILNFAITHGHGVVPVRR